MNPHDAMAYIGRGGVRNAMGDRAGAEKDFAQAAEFGGR